MGRTVEAAVHHLMVTELFWGVIPARFRTPHSLPLDAAAWITERSRALFGKIDSFLVQTSPLIALFGSRSSAECWESTFLT